MSLDYVASTDPIKVETLIVTITSPPGIGKTSLASTANGIMIDADNGQKRTPFRSHALKPSSWADCLAVHEHQKVKDASLVIVDTIGRVTDLCAAAIIAENGKGTVYQGALTLQGYGVLKSRMIPWIQRFAGKDLVLLSHQREEKKRDDLIVRPDIVGSTLQEVLRSSDQIGYLSLVGKVRILDFDPQEDRLGKNAGQLPVLTVPDLTKGKSTFLADLISQAKANMNSRSEESLKAEGEIADWTAHVGTLQSGEDFNTTLESVMAMKDGPVKAQVKTMLNNAAKAAGFEFSKTEKCFKAKVAA